MKNDMMNGVHVRGFAETQADNPKVARLTIQIWPLPYESVEGLHAFLQESANRYLTKAGLTNGDLTDISAKGRPQ